MTYYNNTKTGYKIVNRGTYYNTIEKDSRSYFIIAKRPIRKDYIIGLNYNFFDGTWAQGIYDFKTQQKAQEWLNKNKKLVTYY